MIEALLKRTKLECTLWYIYYYTKGLLLALLIQPPALQLTKVSPNGSSENRDPTLVP